MRAIKRGEKERVLTIPATLLSRAHGLFPGTTSEILGLVNRYVLPSAENSEASSERGADVQANSPSGLRDVLTAWGRSAAERFNEYPERAPATNHDGAP